MITVKGLSKEFNGFLALKGLDMHVKTGEVYGFIGQNGAGKTTTMNILAGLSRPTKGDCVINGTDVIGLNNPGDLGIGYLPENPRFYPWMTARETLEYLSSPPDGGRISRILKWTGLAKAQNRRVGGFSRGMKQRLGIGAALIRNPKLLILDEPSSALDPEGRSAVLHLVRDLKNMGKTILFSTHILDDVERICDTVGMIDAGKMVFEKPLAWLHEEHGELFFDITPTVPITGKSLDSLSQLAGIVSVTRSATSFTVKVSDSTASISVMGFLAGHGIPVNSLSLRKTKLEDLFLQGVHK